MTISHEKLAEILKDIKKHSPNSYILMSPNSIGEVLITCAFAKGFIDTHGKPITLCVRPEHSGIVKALYPNRFQAVINMPMELMSAFKTSGFIANDIINIEQPIVLSPNLYKEGLLLNLHNLVYTRNGSSGITLPDMWRVMLGLNWNTPLEKPNCDFFENEKHILQNFNVTPGEFVLLQLGNNTNKPLPPNFWETLAQSYQNKGLTVLVNSHGAMLLNKTPTFNNVLHVKPNVLEALLLIHHSNVTVSGNNGLIICDILAELSVEQAKTWHVISTDKYCKRYNLLNSDWENAFESFNGKPALHLGASEVISTPDNLKEWFIPTDLADNEYKEIAEDVVNINQESRYFNPMDRNVCNNFPKAKQFHM